MRKEGKMGERGAVVHPRLDHSRRSAQMRKIPMGKQRYKAWITRVKCAFDQRIFGITVEVDSKYD
jgi:hypothetical protein